MSSHCIASSLLPLIILGDVSKVDELLTEGGKNLLDENADPQVKKGLNALFSACEGGQLELVQFLLGVAHKIVYNWAESQFGQYAFIYDLLDEHTIPDQDTMKKILDSPFRDVLHNAIADAAPTVLVYLSIVGRHLEVRTLLKAGVDTEVYVPDGKVFTTEMATTIDHFIRPFFHSLDRTPLILASCIGNHDVVQVLLKNGANVNANDKFGKTPLILASCNNQINVVKLLQNARAEVDAVDSNGNSACDAAKMNHHTGIVSMLEYSKPLP